MQKKHVKNEEEKNTKKISLKLLVKVESFHCAFLYLKGKEKKGINGKNIAYTILDMADYLLPQPI